MIYWQTGTHFYILVMDEVPIKKILIFIPSSRAFIYSRSKDGTQDANSL